MEIQNLHPALNKLSQCTGFPAGSCSLCAKPTPNGGSYANPKFIVVSDYPGAQEVILQDSLVGVTGGFFRRQLLALWLPEQAKELRHKYELTSAKQRDAYNADLVKATNHLAYMTNAIKCKPGDKSVSKGHIQQCKKWLMSELISMPNIPILAAGSVALQALVPELEQVYGSLHEVVGCDKGKLNTFKLRNRVWYDTSKRPYIFTANPYMFEVYSHRTGWQTESYKLEEDYLLSDLGEPLPFSGLWFLRQDLRLLKGVVDGSIK